MKVTVLSSFPPVKGISPYSKGLVEGLSEYIDVECLGFDSIYPEKLYPGAIHDDTSESIVQNKKLKVRNVLNWYNPAQWIIEAFRIKTEIIHAQWWAYPLAPIYLIILGVNKLRGKKIVLTIHNVKPHENSKIKALLNRCVFRVADHYIVHTEQNRKELARITNHNKTISVLPHGLIMTKPQGIERLHARGEFGILPSDKIILCFGSIREYKGLDTAIQALALIVDNNVKLMVAGQCWEDWNQYEELIKCHQLHNRVILKLGFIPSYDVDSIIKLADLILLPYKHFDAQSGVGALVIPYGIPIMVSDVGGLTSYAANEELVFEAGNEKELAQKISTIFSNEQLYMESVKALDNIKQSLDWRVITKDLVDLYQRL